MPVNAFISYSHADEKALERLHKHLAMLRRDNVISAWYDHAILPGAHLGNTIMAELAKSEVFLALLSPDYLASNYCYEKEFEHALGLAKTQKVRIVPIILEPCDWLSSPFKDFMALPKDGKPIAEWTNVNNAYLDVVNGIRRLVLNSKDSPARFAAQNGLLTRRVRLKKDFDTIERAQFGDETFKQISNYFESASGELSHASEDLRTHFESMSATAFTCSIVNRASVRHAEAHITVHNNKGQRHFGDINFVFERHAEANTSHGSIRIDADDYHLYLVTDSFMGSRTEEPKLSPKQACEWLWNLFVQKAGVEYE
jgi:hypothetical protein